MNLADAQAAMIELRRRPEMTLRLPEDTRRHLALASTLDGQGVHAVTAGVHLFRFEGWRLPAHARATLIAEAMGSGGRRAEAEAYANGLIAGCGRMSSEDWEAPDARERLNSRAKQEAMLHAVDLISAAHVEGRVRSRGVG